MHIAKTTPMDAIVWIVTAALFTAFAIIAIPFCIAIRVAEKIGFN